MDHLRVITTGDGSQSLLNTSLQETYHSVHGAVRESMHVFIDHGLKVAEILHPNQVIHILEIGFGTGLNAMLTLMESRRSTMKIVYETWELHPLPDALIHQLNYGSILGDAATFESIHQGLWEKALSLGENFTLFKHRGDVVREPILGQYDLIYYDAFAPSKQAELWPQEILKKVTDRLKPGGVWVTYCAKGQVKRDLASLGLTVETLPGPPGKKEMTRATRRAS